MQSCQCCPCSATYCIFKQRWPLDSVECSCHLSLNNKKRNALDQSMVGSIRIIISCESFLFASLQQVECSGSIHYVPRIDPDGSFTWILFDLFIFGIYSNRDTYLLLWYEVISAQFVFWFCFAKHSFNFLFVTLFAFMTLEANQPAQNCFWWDQQTNWKQDQQLWNEPCPSLQMNGSVTPWKCCILVWSLESRSPERL
jgi:hypothetical protein